MRSVVMMVAVVVALGGCMADDVASNDVASQESAVEGTPAPDPTEDMRYIDHDACDQWCLNKWSDDTRTCADRNPGGTSNDPHHPGPGTPGYWQCLDNANASDEQCSLACDVIFGGTFPRGGSGGTGNLPGNSP